MYIGLVANTCTCNLSLFLSWQILVCNIFDVLETVFRFELHSKSPKTVIRSLRSNQYLVLTINSGSKQGKWLSDVDAKLKVLIISSERLPCSLKSTQQLLLAVVRMLSRAMRHASLVMDDEEVSKFENHQGLGFLEQKKTDDQLYPPSSYSFSSDLPGI